MHLSELREQYTMDEISQKTLISPKNLEALFEEDYASLTKTKALGFLSILERDFHVDIKEMRQNALHYFVQDYKAPSITTSTIKEEEKQRGLGLYLLIVVALLGYTAWYFLIHSGQKSLQDMMPIATKEVNISTTALESNVTKDIHHATQSIENKSFFTKIKDFVFSSEQKVEEKIQPNNVTATASVEITKESNSSEKGFFTKIKDFFSSEKEASIVYDTNVGETSSIVVVNSTMDNSTIVETMQQDDSKVSEKSIFSKIKDFLFSFTGSEQKTEKSYSSVVVGEEEGKKIKSDIEKKEAPADEIAASTVRIEPEKYLWFGLVNRDTGKRDYYSIRKPYTLDVSKNSWLVATNSNAFSLVTQGRTKYFSTSIEHYFIVTKEHIKVLSREEYIAKGGYEKW